jgi:subtilase family serine protease
MRPRHFVIASCLALVACNQGTLGTPSSSTRVTAAPALQAQHLRRACGVIADPNRYHCDVLVRTDIEPSPQYSAYFGYGPSDFQSAYNLPSFSGGSGQTVAVVDVGDDPNAEADLATYRSNYGLAPCTSSSGCFRKLNQKGRNGPYPPPNDGWAVEESLDVDMVSAICPNCDILLMEANESTFRSLGKTVDEAVLRGANVVSNSYGGSGTTGSRYFDHPGTIITASAGDSGYGIQSPADFATVVAVGGTVLSRHKNKRGWSEVVWTGTGSGCAVSIKKPAWQADKGCKGRTMNDVSALATNVAIYDSYQEGGWFTVSGTSISSPLVASVYALAGNASSVNSAQMLYARGASLYDITRGSNGTCQPTYLCTAGRGYDGPSGNGTPNGTTAF